MNSRFEITDVDNGRVEVRRHWISHDMGWLASAPTVPRRASLPKPLRRCGSQSQSRAPRQHQSKTAPLPIFHAAQRQTVRLRRALPLACQNRLHWVLDVFHQDPSRLRSGARPQNMATVRHMAMNLLRKPKDKHSLKVRQK